MIELREVTHLRSIRFCSDDLIFFVNVMFIEVPLLTSAGVFDLLPAVTGSQLSTVATLNCRSSLLFFLSQACAFFINLVNLDIDLSLGGENHLFVLPLLLRPSCSCLLSHLLLLSCPASYLHCCHGKTMKAGMA